MRWLQIETALALAAGAWFASRVFRSAINPVSMLFLPFAVTLLVEALFMPQAPFSWKAAAAIMLPLSGFAVFAMLPFSLQRVDAPSLDLRLARPALALTGVILVAVGSSIGAFFTRSFVQETALGVIRPGVFSRALVYDAVAGTREGLLFRAILFLFFVSTIVMAFYWLARGPARRIAFVVFAAAFSIHSVTLASKLPLFLAAVLLTIVYLLFRPVSFRRIVSVFAALSLVIISVFVVVSVRRHGEEGRSEYGALYYGLFGGPSAFAVVLEGERTGAAINRGLAIGGLVEVFRLGDRTLSGGEGRPLGQGFDSVRLDENDPTSITNIYTGIFYFHRDLGWLGTLVAFMILGALASWSYRRAYRAPSASRLMILANVYLLLACMPISTMTYYNFWWALLILAPVLALPFQVVTVGAHDDP